MTNQVIFELMLLMLNSTQLCNSFHLFYASVQVNNLTTKPLVKPASEESDAEPMPE